MSKNAILGIVIVAVILLGGFLLIKSQGNVYNKPNTSVSTTPSESTAPNSSSTTTSTSSQPTENKFTVNADDSRADLTTINVKKGDSVSITFNVKKNDVYRGGLDFRSDQISTGTIAPGSSKTITFTATGSFKFTPYWPSSNVAKPYTISVVVQ